MKIYMPPMFQRPIEILKEEISLTLSSGADGFLLVAGVDDLPSIYLRQRQRAGDTVLKNAAETLEDVTYGTRQLHRVTEVDPIGSTRVLEPELKKVHRFYQALLSGTIAYAQVDLEGGHLMSVGGVWRPYHQDYRTTSRDFINVFQNKLTACLPKEQFSLLDGYRDASTWAERLSGQDQ